MVESEVHVSGKGESIHIQRDPMRRRRGYYTQGWTHASKEEWRLHRHIYDPKADCPACEGKPYGKPDPVVNIRRSHYTHYKACRTCGGTGKRKNDDE